ncbi:MAG: hypothetical protein V4611_04540 [Patescibacteria group bacterium]
MQKKQPFEETISHSMELRGISFSEAMIETQQRYERFVDSNNKSIERQDDRANTALIQLISHFALLATLTLTVTGFLITQADQELTGAQQWLIISIMIMQVVSLFFGALDYWQTIKFHTNWAKLYQSVGDKVSEKINSGDVQYFSDLTAIEDKMFKAHESETNKVLTVLMVVFCLSGLSLLLILFTAYFFDIPVWQ